MSGTIDHWNKYKVPQINALSQAMSDLKKELSVEIELCHERSNYEKQLAKSKAKPLFSNCKFRFEEVILNNNKLSTCESKGTKRKRGGDNELGCPELSASKSEKSDQLYTSMEDNVERNDLLSTYKHLSSNVRKCCCIQNARNRYSTVVNTYCEIRRLRIRIQIRRLRIQNLEYLMTFKYMNSQSPISAQVQSTFEFVYTFFIRNLAHGLVQKVS